MNDATAKQLRLIEEIRAALDAAKVEWWWLFGGWAMDFNVGEITRDHSDIEIFIWLNDAAAVRDVLERTGFAAPPALHRDECQPFLKDGQEIGAWYLVRAAMAPSTRQGAGRTGRGPQARSMSRGCA